MIQLLSMISRGEKQSGQETKTMLPEATANVSSLYMGELMGRHVLKDLTPSRIKDRDGLWEQAAQKFSPFSETIRTFRVALKNNEVAREQENEVVMSMLGLYFHKVGDIMARDFLTDVLIIRMTDKQCRFDRTIIPHRQADAMGGELGLKDLFIGEEAKTLKLEKAVEAVLMGQLKLSPAETNSEIALEKDTHVEFLEEVNIDEKGNKKLHLYTDDRVKELTQMFDPKSYKGFYMSSYGDASLEIELFPLVALGWSLDRYVGVDKRDMVTLRNWANGLTILKEINLTDIRTVKHGDIEICFPTAQLLENFNIRERTSKRK